jgi:hypothetical protein
MRPFPPEIGAGDFALATSNLTGGGRVTSLMIASMKSSGVTPAGVICRSCLVNRQPATIGFSLVLGLRLPAGSLRLYLGKALQLVLRRVFPRGGDVEHS